MFSVLIASVMMISISETHSAFADTPIDATDYFGQALKIFDQQQKIVSEASGLQQQIADLKASSTADTTTINSRIVSLQQQLDADNNQIESDAKEIKRLEALNIKSYQVDPQTEKKLYATEKALFDKYVGNNKSIDNPVQIVFADLKHRHIVVMLDPDQVGNTSSPMTKIRDTNNVLQTVPLDAKSIQSVEPTGDVPVEIKYGKIKPASCTDRNQPCNPLIGGLSVSLKDNVPNSLNTLGYKATLNGIPGYVIAGHTAEHANEIGIYPAPNLLGRQIVQPYNSPNNVIGTVYNWCLSNAQYADCDFAFVRTDQNGKTSSNAIYQNAGTVFNIIGYTPKSQQTVGSFAYKSGAATGTTLGQITSNSQTFPHLIVQIYGGAGDSGSPVVSYETNNANANLYGVLYQAQLNGGNPMYGFDLYYPWDYVQSRMNAIPSS